jgi:hypothetical protein
MITGDEFIELARRRFAPFARSLGMAETASLVDKTFAELSYAKRSRAFDVVMDRAEDYRVAVVVHKLDGKPPREMDSRDPEDFTRFDLQAVLARSGAEWDGPGKYGPGTRDDVDAAITEVLERLETFGRPLLSGGAREWRRLQNLTAERVRAWEAARDIHRR